MKKRIFAIILAALMVVPFGMLSVSADAASVPAEPTATGTKTYYVSYQKTGDGSTADAPANTKGWGEGGNFAELVKEGGTVSIVGKCYVDATATMPATTAPLVFTANGEIGAINNETNSAHGSQEGMVMVAVGGYSITFMGDVIFDNTVLLDRGKTAAVSTYSVGSTGKMVIKDNVKIACTTWNNTKDHNPKLNVEEGGYAYLHAVGFSAYTGKGTIVLDTKLVQDGTATAEMFAGFEGKIVDKDGNAIVFKTVADTSDDTTTAPTTTTTAGETTTAPTTTAPTTTTPTDNPTTGDMTVVVAALAALSVAACISVVIVKKTKEN